MASSQLKTPGDVINWEVKDQYTRIEAAIKNGTGASRTFTDICGIPLKLVSGVYELAMNTDVASIVAICLGEGPLTLASAATSTVKYPILVRGPAILRKSGIPTTDPAGTTYTWATLESSLAAKDMIITTDI